MANKKLKRFKGRVIAVDVLRGMTVILMLFVDSPVGNQFDFTRHASWIGMNPPDFVFPSFITLMGISIFFSLSKFDFKPTKESIFRILRRFVLLCVFGWLIARINSGIVSAAQGGDFISAVLDFSLWRVMGIFQRIAICYLFGSLIALFVHSKKVFIAIIVFLLVGYAVILGLFNGYEQSEKNIISIFDQSILGTNHMYQMKMTDGSKIAFDPEGLLSSIPCIAQTLLGFLIGGIIREKGKRIRDKVISILIIGLLLLLIGYLLSLFIPSFKKAWTTSFVLITTGFVFSLLASFMWIIDVKGHKKWCKFFQVYGSNALISFAAQDILWTFLAKFQIAIMLYNLLVLVCFGVEGVASLLTSIAFMLLWYLVLYLLDKKKIYIRL